MHKPLQQIGFTCLSYCLDLIGSHLIPASYFVCLLSNIAWPTNLTSPSHRVGPRSTWEGSLDMWIPLLSTVTLQLHKIRALIFTFILGYMDYLLHGSHETPIKPKNLIINTTGGGGGLFDQDLYTLGPPKIEYFIGLHCSLNEFRKKQKVSVLNLDPPKKKCEWPVTKTFWKTLML